MRSSIALVLILFSTASFAGEPPTAAELASAPNTPQASPCQPIKNACLSSGFVLGGKAGSRLIVDCIDKLVQGKAVVSPANGAKVEVPAGTNLAACAQHIHHGKRHTAGMKARAVPTYKN